MDYVPVIGHRFSTHPRVFVIPIVHRGHKPLGLNSVEPYKIPYSEVVIVPRRSVSYLTVHNPLVKTVGNCYPMDSLANVHRSGMVLIVKLTSVTYTEDSMEQANVHVSSRTTARIVNSISAEHMEHRKRINPGTLLESVHVNRCIRA